MAALFRAINLKSPNAKSFIFRYCSFSSFPAANISELLDDIPDVLVSALRLGPAGCSLGQQNRNSFTSGYIDIELLVNQNTKNAVGTTMKSLFSDSIHNIKNGVDLKNYEVAVRKLNEFLKNKGMHLSYLC